MDTSLAAVTLLLGLLDRATQIATIINTARAEGRDISLAELDGLATADMLARQALVDAIARAKAAQAATPALPPTA